MATLNIIRDSGYADRLRAYKIVLDEQEVGEIKNGEAKTLAIPPGQHQLSFKIDWCGSQTVQFAVAEGGSSTFTVKSNLRGPKLAAALWYVIFDRNSYLTIEQELQSQPKAMTSQLR
jgi:hypothetical protein